MSRLPPGALDWHDAFVFVPVAHAQFGKLLVRLDACMLQKAGRVLHDLSEIAVLIKV